MSQKPVPFLRETFPALFEKGIRLLEARAAGGDATAAQLLDNAKAVDGAALIRIEGEGDVYIAAQGGSVKTSDAPIAGVSIKMAARIPGEAATLVLGQAAKDGALDDDRLAIGVTQTANRELEQALAGRDLTCHITLAGTPELGDVTVWLGFNVAEPPEKPKFTATLKYDDFEDIREKKVNVQQAFMQGKLRMTGDYSVALQIAMQMAAKAQQQAKKI
jgi:putative sterol carrier protein